MIKELNQIIELTTKIDESNMEREVWCIVKNKTMPYCFLMRLKYDSRKQKWIQKFKKVTTYVSSIDSEEELDEYLSVVAILDFKSLAYKKFEVPEVEKPTEEEVSDYWVNYFK
jgi:hypothetical protein